jgi:hypothetical protein
VSSMAGTAAGVATATAVPHRKRSAIRFTIG